MTICERCGHEHERLVDGYGRLTNDYAAHQINECIANLRADLAFLRAAKDGRDAEFAQALADLEAERVRSWDGWALAVYWRGYVRLTQVAEERAARAEFQCAALREAAAQAAETQPFYPDTHTGMRQAWVRSEIARKIRALDPALAGLLP